MSTPAATSQQGTYTIDPAHTSVEFVVRHLMIAKVRGRFAGVAGDIVVGASGIPTRVDVSVDVATVDTREEKRDAHLRSGDFFDVEKHPTMTFTSSQITESGSDFAMRGSLTIAGVARDVTFEGTFNGRGSDPWGGARVGYEAQATIDRKDFGLEFNMPLDTGGVVIGEEVKIELNVEAVLKK